MIAQLRGPGQLIARANIGGPIHAKVRLETNNEGSWGVLCDWRKHHPLVVFGNNRQMRSQLTPSKITAWLDCSHYLTLTAQRAAGTIDTSLLGGIGSMARMLMEKGNEHEQARLTRYESDGLTVFDAQQIRPGKDFGQWVQACEDVLTAGHDVVFQMPFEHKGMRGVADFLERVDNPDLGGAPQYEPVDAKLARSEAKPGHLLQLCFYADAIEAATGHRPVDVHIELGSGMRETVRLAGIDAYWRRLQRQLENILDTDASNTTVPLPCSHCDFCEYNQICTKQWRSTDSLVFVANLQARDRSALEAAGVATLNDLADSGTHIEGIDPTVLNRARSQARLQREHRDNPNDPPPFQLITNEDNDTTDLVGFALLPKPAPGDVFLDFEGHPFWSPQNDLFFLFGLIEEDPTASSGWGYRCWWAHDKAEEQQAVADLIDYLVARRAKYPGMHVYHYNHTERSGLERLVEQRVNEVDLDKLITTGAFVDLYRVMLTGVQVGTESYGLKDIEKLTDFERRPGIDQGSGAVIEYDSWLVDEDPARLDRIRTYNDDDVRATLAVRDWLVAHRPTGIDWRPPAFDRSDKDDELDDRICRLHTFDLGTPQHLLGDLLGYWRREKRAVSANIFVISTSDLPTQLKARGVIAELTTERVTKRFGKGGKPLKNSKGTLTYPDQTISADIHEGSRLVEVRSDGKWSFFAVIDADHDNNTINVKWPTDRDETDHPSILIEYDWVDEGAKHKALIEVAERVLGDRQSALVDNILTPARPRFRSSGGPTSQVFGDDIDEICRWAIDLDQTVVPIQGPPGTGKTYNGSRLAHSLAQSGQRVGILAMSHKAIENLVEATIEVYKEEGDLKRLRLAVKPGVGGCDVPDDHITIVKDNKKPATGGFEIVAGTAWMFASTQMQDNPVDVLLVDEAGQLGLADLLAASLSAKSMILLGDPQQLPQVAQALHPNSSGSSGLEHLIGDTATIDPERGVLLRETRRMHPNIAKFISETMYDGELGVHPTAAGQTTTVGTGLRWIQAHHNDCSTEAPEEADLIANEIERLLKQEWTNERGETGKITTKDIIVVAPYNQQRHRLRAVLDARSNTKGVEVGTVDKFQGREAAVVFFSMTSSSQADMPRGIDFLFSKNRLNVAISRARCLAYLVSTEELLNTRATDTATMEMVSAVARFVELAQPVGR